MLPSEYAPSQLIRLGSALAAVCDRSIDNAASSCVRVRIGVGVVRGLINFLSRGLAVGDDLEPS